MRNSQVAPTLNFLRTYVRLPWGYLEYQGGTARPRFLLVFDLTKVDPEMVKAIIKSWAKRYRGAITAITLHNNYMANEETQVRFELRFEVQLEMSDEPLGNPKGLIGYWGGLLERSIKGVTNIWSSGLVPRWLLDRLFHGRFCISVPVESKLSIKSLEGLTESLEKL